MGGKFVISLDYELHWGIFDIMSVEDYRENLENTEIAIERMVALSDQFDVKLTFATVGMLFAQNKDELQEYLPSLNPTYAKEELNPYTFLKSVGYDKEEAPFHYGKSTVAKLGSNSRHELGTHTFSHYYCLEEGQTPEQFDADIKAAKKIAQSMNLDVKSIVFPRNQVNDAYLKVCTENGITSYRGTESAAAYNPKKPLPGRLKRGLRLIDCYLNILGHHTVPITQLTYDEGECLNIPSSRFLRPYDKKLALLQPLRINRIQKAMTHAAKKGDLFHLWWHPHNFGKNLEENMKDLEKIYVHYKKLNRKYGFESETMTSLTEKIAERS